MVIHLHVSGLLALVGTRQQWLSHARVVLSRTARFGISCFLVVMSLLTYAPRMKDRLAGPLAHQLTYSSHQDR